MRDLTIKNFRCYENKSIEFRSGINLLIGDNSVGKTSLLRACNFAVNAFFSGYSDENTLWISADNNDFRNTGVAEQPVEIMLHLGDWDYPTISTPIGESYSFDMNTDLKIEKKSKKNSRNLVSGLIPLRDYASRLKMWSHIISEDKSIQQINPLPVYGCFTTEDIHAVRKINKDKFKTYMHKPSFGYYECYDCRGLFECWIKRLLVLKEAKRGNDEINSVRNAVIEALGSDGCNIINDIDIRQNEGKVYFHFVDGRESESNLLSDGYRRLVNIVIDIAFRCALLNKTMYGEQCYKHTHGTIIIDEIDEHLHPALQVRVLKALQTTFPKIQFIISTHSPLVISSVEPLKDEYGNEKNIVYKLEYNDGIYSHTEVNAYGLDSNLILEEKVGVLSRVPIIDSKIKTIIDLISERRLKEANQMISELETITDPTQPELVKLRAILNRIEVIGV